MSNSELRKLISKAREMALSNTWDDSAFEVNMQILEIDDKDFGAYTRLAKYYKLSNNLTAAKEMYVKALEINPESQGVRNNLDEIIQFQQEEDYVNKISTSKELYDSGRGFVQKGRNRLAVKCFKKAYSIEPTLKYALTLAKIYSKSGKPEKVSKLYNDLLKKSTSTNAIESINEKFLPLMQK